MDLICVFSTSVCLHMPDTPLSPLVPFLAKILHLAHKHTYLIYCVTLSKVSSHTFDKWRGKKSLCSLGKKSLLWSKCTNPSLNIQTNKQSLVNWSVHDSHNYTQIWVLKSVGVFFFLHLARPISGQASKGSWCTHHNSNVFLIKYT